MCLCNRHYQFNSQRFGPGGDYIAGLFEYTAVNKKFRYANMLVVPVFLIEKHDHCFSGGGSFIEQGCIGKGRPVKSLTMVWKFNKLSSRP